MEAKIMTKKQQNPTIFKDLIIENGFLTR